MSWNKKKTFTVILSNVSDEDDSTAHIKEVLNNEIWVVKEWFELFCNLSVLSVDPAASSDCYKC